MPNILVPMVHAVTTNGVPVIIPKMMLDVFGDDVITLEIRRPKKRVHESQIKWLTVTEAASLFAADMNVTLESAKNTVSRDATRGAFQTNGETGRARRIDPASFALWRLKQRDMDLDQEDD